MACAFSQSLSVDNIVCCKACHTPTPSLPSPKTIVATPSCCDGGYVHQCLHGVNEQAYLPTLQKCGITFSCLSSLFLIQAWSQFGESLPDLQYPLNRQQAVHCLNLLVTNALHHVPDVLTYMERIQNQSVFNFCAIPQVCTCLRSCD